MRSLHQHAAPDRFGPPVPRHAASSGDSASGVSRALRVVVADDVHDTVTTMVAVLREEGHDVIGVHDGEEALKAVREFRPDVVILDIGMPRLSGYEVAKALRAEYGTACPTLIAVTAYAKATDRLIGKSAGFDHYFGKPASLPELFEVLSKIDTSGRGP